MAVKIRLQRHGKKGKPFYWIVAADSRAKRDGKYLEKLGVYDPNINPARVEVNVEKALKWLQNGAIPTNTARTLLSYRGVMLKHHLDKGVLKGALKQEKADEQFKAWLKDKESKISSKQDKISKEIDKSKAERLKLEKESNEKRALDRENAAKAAAAKEEVPTEEAPDEEAAAKEEVPTEEAPAEEAAAKEEVPKEEAPTEETLKEKNTSKDDDASKQE